MTRGIGKSFYKEDLHIINGNNEHLIISSFFKKGARLPTRFVFADGKQISSQYLLDTVKEENNVINSLYATPKNNVGTLIDLTSSLKSYSQKENSNNNLSISSPYQNTYMYKSELKI